MKKTLLSSALAAVVFATCLAWTCFSSAQAPPQGQPMGTAFQSPGPIALVDINAIFKRHVRLKANLKELEGEAAKIQKDFEVEMQDLQKESEKLRYMKVGSPEYQNLEETLVSKKSAIQTRIALRRKEFVQKEAHHYFNAYREITAEVEYFCRQHGIVLVLNFNNDNINDTNADDIARNITSKVVFFEKPLDITWYILQPFVKPLQADNRNGGGPPPTYNFPK